MKFQNVFLTTLFFIFSFVPATAQSGGTFHITRSVIASGGGQNSSGVSFSADGTNGQSAAGTQSNGGNFNVVGGFWVEPVLIPTAAHVSVSGRVITQTGSGVNQVIVRLIALSGETKTILSSSLGYYRFTDVQVGETYIISVESKRYTFSQPMVVRTVLEEISDLNFIADIN